MNKTGKHNSCKSKQRLRCSAGFMLEYLLVSVAILGGLLLMFTFLRQSISGRFKSTADVFGAGRQYEYQQPHQTDISVVEL